MQVMLAIEKGATNGHPLDDVLRKQDERIQVETIADRVLERLQVNDKPDVLLLDFRFPGLSGLEGIRTVLKYLGDRPLGVLVDRTASIHTGNAFVAGASGVLPLDLTAEAFDAAVTLLLSGFSFAIINQKQACDRLKAISTLSDREIQVLKGICNGLQNKEIGHAFDIQEVTVKMHVRAIIQKLGARNRTHAAMLARDLGVV
ncbi:response regulator transcription factor [Sinisalibacter lacisalsi]|uniref:LuxR family transcriptional regulator n=1 Tax=Sinisalibacter lacisalsi TaxID=1526570 RepID=A0ABQ1QLT3_9RHOB|nr:response regulator transcription factor [Sinisalibacter lacisalsi]GGD29908.1 LuxR family transcriptional regulator [Sinisalibacter lacisalsi]